MRIAIYDAKPYDRQFFAAENDSFGFELTFLEERLTPETVERAAAHDAVCCFVNDQLSGENIEALAQAGVKIIALRCAGFNHVDLDAVKAKGLTVVRVPAYSPLAVAEHALALILGLNRKIHRANNRIREGNFTLNGLLGFDVGRRTVGVVGTGKIGVAFAQIMRGLGCEVLGFDPYPNESAKEHLRYVALDELFAQASIISLHCPLTDATDHLINAESIAKMQRGVMLINTGRGRLVDTSAAIEGLKSGQIGYLGMDVYEEESGLFFEDHSQEIIQDDKFARLMMFPNVLVTGHQAFFTADALTAIAQTTQENIRLVDAGEDCPNVV